MLPTIIFFFALTLSILTTCGWVYFMIGMSNKYETIYKDFNNSQEDFKINIYMTIISCILWSILFYLLH